jgi:hypothetical protein
VESAVLEGARVRRALVYRCSECGEIAGAPQVTAGRVFAALEAERAEVAPTELRVPEEAEDLAFAVHAALGVRPSGDVFALAIAVGLRHAGMRREVDERWQVLDGLEKRLRARPVLSGELLQRIDGLQKVWGAPDRSTVARWLIAAGAQSVGAL